MTYYTAKVSNNNENNTCILIYEDDKLKLYNKDLIIYAGMYRGSIPIFFEILKEYFSLAGLDEVEVTEKMVFAPKRLENDIAREIVKIAIMRCSMDGGRNLKEYKARLKDAREALEYGNKYLYDNYTKHSIIYGPAGFTILISKTRITEELLNEKIDEIVPKAQEINGISKIKK